MSGTNATGDGPHQSTPASSVQHSERTGGVKITIIPVSDPEEPDDVLYERYGSRLSIKGVFHSILTLLRHPGKGRISDETGRAKEIQCTHEFIRLYFHILENLKLYFAYFVHEDDSVHKALWFDFLKNVARMRLPHGRDGNQPVCTHSADFNRTADLHYDIIHHSLNRHELLHRFSFSTAYNTPKADNAAVVDSAFGLRPFQRYLYSDAPGHNVPLEEHVFLHMDMPVQEQPTTTQIMPPGGVAILQEHQSRLGELVDELVEAEPGRCKVYNEWLNQNTIAVDGAFKFKNIHGQDTQARYVVVSPTSAVAPKRPQPINVIDSKDENLSSEMADQVTGDYEGYGADDHPKGERQFNMMQIRTSIQTPNDTDFVQTFGDWED